MCRRCRDACVAYVATHDTGWRGRIRTFDLLIQSQIPESGRADGTRLAALVAALADGLLSLHVGATFALADAATALQGAVTGRAAGATVLTLEGISSDAADQK